jgi:hypothetical protein
MKRIKSLVSALVVTGLLGYSVAAMSAEAAKPQGVKPGVITAVALNRSGTYCHLRFPAIKEQTLGTKNPQLKPADTGDIIDFYGPCSYDPVGPDEVCKQQAMRLNEKFCSSD